VLNFADIIITVVSGKSTIMRIRIITTLINFVLVLDKNFPFLIEINISLLIADVVLTSIKTNTEMAIAAMDRF
jgi:hypothetical protein